ncbi:MAG: hypothetical protein ACI828_002838 [Flavobacteriales bacterium]
MKTTFSLLIFLYLTISTALAQSLAFNGGALLKAEIALGSQNQWLKIGALGYGTLNYGDVSIESGVSVATYTFVKRHTVKQQGLAYSYEVFALAGVGKNSNLLGSSISDLNSQLLFNPSGKGGFNGIGLGFGKDYLPKKLKPYGLRRGQILMRFSNADHSVQMVFQNDVKLGNVFRGEGTDYGTTGSLSLGFVQIRDPFTAYEVGIAVEVFTARPNYTELPVNKINSDDGRKPVWFVLGPFEDLFYSNLYAFGSYHDLEYSVSAKLGVNSQRMGAYIQNTLHDGFGLNPRFPWDVTAKDHLFFEMSGSGLLNARTDD